LKKREKARKNDLMLVYGTKGMENEKEQRDHEMETVTDPAPTRFSFYVQKR
jgi:hypothetical protein